MEECSNVCRNWECLTFDCPHIFTYFNRQKEVSKYTVKWRNQVVSNEWGRQVNVSNLVSLNEVMKLFSRYLGETQRTAEQPV